MTNPKDKDPKKPQGDTPNPGLTLEQKLEIARGLPQWLWVKGNSDVRLLLTYAIGRMVESLAEGTDYGRMGEVIAEAASSAMEGFKGDDMNTMVALVAEMGLAAGELSEEDVRRYTTPSGGEDQTEGNSVSKSESHSVVGTETSPEEDGLTTWSPIDGKKITLN